ncbi:hypothetical protein WDW89_23795 [Deltaproteobacteria bacterium TL4]
MLEWRSITFSARLAFPDVLAGIYSSKEINDFGNNSQKQLQTEQTEVQSVSQTEKFKQIIKPDPEEIEQEPDPMNQEVQVEISLGSVTAEMPFLHPMEQFRERIKLAVDLDALTTIWGYFNEHIKEFSYTKEQVQPVIDAKNQRVAELRSLNPGIS